MFLSTDAAVVFVVFMLIGLTMTAVWIVALIDALRIPEGTWQRAGQSKLLWVLLIAILGLLGALLYAVMARPALSRARPGGDLGGAPSGT